MQAITTKYLPWTDTKPSRIKATAASGISVTITLHGDIEGDAHDEAVRRLVAKLGWGPATYVRGASKDGFVYVDERDIKVRCAK